MMKTTLVLAVGALLALPAGAAPAEDPFTDAFRLQDCTLVADGRNPWFSLVPGDRLVLEGEDDGEEIVVAITVLRDRQPISFLTPDGQRIEVRARVVEEREWVDDELVEVSRNFFARCAETQDIYYFGEDVDDYEDGVIVGHGGAWRAGRNGALPGLIMPATFLLGARYFQEIAPGVALDRAEHVAMGLILETEAGTFEDCVEVRETTPLEPRSESVKIYCPGVGLVVDNGIALAEFDVAGLAETEDVRRGALAERPGRR